MDIEEFIKLEENNFSDEELPPQHFPHDFYDQDSELEQDRPCVPIEEVLSSLHRSSNKLQNSKASSTCLLMILC